MGSVRATCVSQSFDKLSPLEADYKIGYVNTAYTHQDQKLSLLVANFNNMKTA